MFAFCTDGDRLSAQTADRLSLIVTGPFAAELPDNDGNLAMRAARSLADAAGIEAGATLTLDKRLPVASGIGGGSADAAATLRLLTSFWRIDPKHAEEVAPQLGSDVPACLLSLPARGEGAGDQLSPIDLPELSGTPVLLVNPGVGLFTAEVFARWSGIDGGALRDWRGGRNDLEKAAISLVPQIEAVLAWLRNREGAALVRMSGSGATCFATFESEAARDAAAQVVPAEWWHLATFLR